MRARIGIADTGHEIEVVGERDELVDRIEQAFADRISLLWFRDSKGREVAIPRERIAFIQLEDSPETRVGFAN